MRSSDLTFALLAALLSLAAPAAGQAPEPDAKAAARLAAKAHFDAGRAAFKARDFDKAIKAFEEAARLDPHPILVFNIGRALEEKGELEAAIKRFEEYLALPVSQTEATEVSIRISRLKALIEERRRSIPGSLIVEGCENGAAIAVDGAGVGTYPLARAHAIPPGERLVSAERDGRRAEMRVTVKPGEAVTVRLALPPPAPAPEPDVRAVSAPPGRPARTWAWVALAAGAALGAGGGTLLFLAESDRDKVRAAHATDSGGETVVDGITRAEALSLRDSADTKAAAGVALLAASGAALAGSAVLFLLPSGGNGPDKTGAAQAIPGRAVLTWVWQ